MTDKLEIVIIELPKIIKEEQTDNELLDWLFFLENPNSERMKKKMETNKELKEAKEKLDTMSEDERMQRIADLRQKAIWDENSIRNDGIREGIRKGIKQGHKENNLEIAKKMLNENLDIELIIKITGLSKEEIINLQNK